MYPKIYVRDSNNHSTAMYGSTDNTNRKTVNLTYSGTYVTYTPDSHISIPVSKTSARVSASSTSNSNFIAYVYSVDTADWIYKYHIVLCYNITDMISTVYRSAYEKYSSYFQRKKPFTEFLEYIKKHYKLREVSSNECYRFEGKCRDLRINTEHAYGNEGKDFPPSVYAFYEVMNYDFMMTGTLDQWDGYRVFIIVDSVMETYDTNSGYLMNELKIIRGIQISDPVDLTSIELRDYLSSFLFLFEEYPKLLILNMKERISSISE